MALTVLAGRITGVQTGLRIANRPVVLPWQVNLADGDLVTAVGFDSPEFRIVALRNDSTGIIYKPAPPTLPELKLDWPGIILSLFLIPLLIGIFYFWNLGKSYLRLNRERDAVRAQIAEINEAERLLASTPSAAATSR